MFGTDLERFFEEQKGGIRVGQAAPVAGKVAVGTDGYVCLQVGVEDFSIPIDNPLGYTFKIESTFTQTLGAGMDLSVSQEGPGSLAVHIPQGNTAGNEGTLHVKIMTAKEGRILYQGDIGVAYFNLDDFTTGLTIELNADPSILSFTPGTTEYSYANAPLSFPLTVTPSTANTGPHAPLIFVAVDGAVPNQGPPDTWTIIPHQSPSVVTVRVELPHGAASETYTVAVHLKEGEASLELDWPFAPYKTVYQAGDALNTAGLSLHYAPGGGPVDLAACDIIYNFSKPGNKTVFITYDDSITGTLLDTRFSAWVVGLNSLTVSGDGIPALGLDDFEASGAYDLGMVPPALTALTITASSTIEDAIISIKGSPAASGVPSDIPLDPGPNTIPITVRVDRASPNIEERTYTLSVFRTPEWYVAPGGNDGNSGVQSAPLRTVAEALNRAKSFGDIPGAEVVIVISGEVDTDTGTANGMVDISDTGYPHIILKGAATGYNAIDVSGKVKRVLYIGGGNTVSLGDNLTLTGGFPTSSAGSGGGVYVDGGTFTMSGTAAIRGNNVLSGGGGGVYVNGGTFTMTGGVIENNTASGSGGGVAITGSGSTFTMTGGVIQNNAASFIGGGVYIVSNSGGTTFIKTGGIIDGNNTASNGRAVYLGGKRRDTTVGTDATGRLYAKYSGGSWSYVDPASGGLGNTEENWDRP
jgi:hypothetical protein